MLFRSQVKLLVVLTKADKLNRKESSEILRRVTESLGAYATEESDVGVVLFSALKKTGVEDVAQVLHGWCHDQ